jgi:hypothetical protein
MANAGVTLSDGVAGRRSGRHTDGLGSLHVLDQLIIAGRVKPGHRALRQEAPLADRVSAVLAVLYVTDVVGLQTAFDAVSPAARNTLATAGLTLLVAALFRPVRSRFEAVRRPGPRRGRGRRDPRRSRRGGRPHGSSVGVRCWLRKAP